MEYFKKIIKFYAKIIARNDEKYSFLNNEQFIIKKYKELFNNITNLFYIMFIYI